MFNYISKVTVNNLISTLDKSTLLYQVKHEGHCTVFKKYMNGEEIKVSNDILLMSIRDFMNRDKTGDDVNNSLIEEILKSGQYHLRKLVQRCLSLLPISSLKHRYIFTPHCNVTVSLVEDIKQIKSYLFNIPADGITLDIKDGFYSMDTAMFNSVISAIDYYVDDQEEFGKQWTSFKEEDDLIVFGIDVYPTIHDDIVKLIDTKYNTIKYRQMREGDLSSLIIGSTEHVVIKQPDGSCNYRLFINVGYHEAIQGSIYTEYSCVSKMAQYLFFINQLPKGK